MLSWSNKTLQFPVVQSGSVIRQQSTTGFYFAVRKQNQFSKLFTDFALKCILHFSWKTSKNCNLSETFELVCNVVFNWSYKCKENRRYHQKTQTYCDRLNNQLTGQILIFHQLNRFIRTIRVFFTNTRTK